MTDWVCPFCRRADELKSHDCRWMHEALRAFGVEIAAAPAAAAGGSSQVARPHLSVVRNDAPPAPSKEDA